MQLIRLLSVSETFVRGEIPMGRYHALRGRALPKFGRTEAVKEEAGVMRTGAAASMENRAPSPKPYQSLKTKGSTYQLPGVNADRSAGGSGRLRAMRSGWGWGLGAAWGGFGMKVWCVVKRWAVRVWAWLVPEGNPFIGRSKGLRGSVTQATLRLDEVQVIRNDLSDTDFEIMATRRRAAGVAPAARLSQTGAASGTDGSVACSFAAGGGGGGQSPALEAGARARVGGV